MATVMERRRMPPALRRTVYVGVSALWLSGGALLVLQLFFRRTDEFGLARHPLEPGLLTLHGVLAVLGLYLLGWLSARHVGEAWRLAERRSSGVTLLATLGILALSGFALFFLTGDALRAGAAGLHDWLGALALVPALAHWLVPRRR
jgi:hypothetical protein